MKRFIRINVIIFIIIIVCLKDSYSQKKDFVYQKNPYLQTGMVNTNRITVENKVMKSAIDLTKYLPEDFVKDASKDYTEYIQKGIDENKIVKMPNFPLRINKSGLNLKSGARIVFQKKSSLNMEPNSLEVYGILKLFNIEDVIIYSPVIIGDRNMHIGTKGEWGMGIFIQSAKNIQIYNPKISNCWGDGIDIGKGDYDGSRNIKIINAEIDNCRRNGISICDGNNIIIDRPAISNTNGTPPMCGIDIEPNDNKAILENIHIINPITFNNSTAGILIYLDHFLGPIKKNVGISIENHIDNNSDIGFILGKYREQNNTNQQHIGSIDIINPIWKNNRQSINAGNNLMGPLVNFKNIKIENSKENLQKIKQELSNIKNIYIN